MKKILLLLIIPVLLYSKTLINKNDYFKVVLNASSSYELNYKLKKKNDLVLIENFFRLVNSDSKSKKKITLYKSKKNKGIRYAKIIDGTRHFQIYYIKSEKKYFISSNSRKYNNLYIDRKDLLSLGKPKKILLRMPLKYKYISSHFSKRRYHPILKKYRAHKGIDLVNNKNTPIRAAATGVVTKLGRNGSYGKFVEIKHKNGFYTEYAHLNKYNKRLKKGMKIKVGQVLGFLGNTGRSTGPHLHFGLRHYKKFLNPLKYMVNKHRKGFIYLAKKNNYLKNNRRLNRNIRIIKNKLNSITPV